MKEMGPNSEEPLLQLSSAVAQAEDLLLLSRYEEAADSAASILPGLVELVGNRESPSATPLLQRALVAALQAHFFCGRQAHFEALVEALGLQCLAVPTFLAWVLMLLECGQAGAARQRVETYMAAILSLAADQHQHPQQQLQQQLRQQGAAASGADAARHAPAPAAAATAQDRAALARVYSQDVLAVGLGLPTQALDWLAPPPPLAPAAAAAGLADAAETAARGGGSSTGGRTGRIQGSAHVGGAAGMSAAAPTVVTARELLGSDEAVATLRAELEVLAAAAAAAAAGARSRAASRPSSGRSSCSGSAKQQQGQQPHPQSQQQQAPRQRRSCEGSCNSAASGYAGAMGGAERAPTTAGRGISAQPGGSAGLRACSRSNDVHAATTANSTSRSTAVTSLLLSRLAALFRSFASAVVALAARLAVGASVRLTRAQAWLVCTAASAAAKLRASAAGSSGSGVAKGSTGGGRLGGGGGGSNGGSSLSAAHLAAAVALGAVVVVAVSAEAPHLRAGMQGLTAGLVGLFREAMGMGMGFHPSPVAVAGGGMVG